MEYVHPKKYEGVRIDTPNNQAIKKAYVERNCLRCDLFCGKEHDFSECDPRVNSPNCTCPPECRKPVSLIDPYCGIKCKTE